MMKREVFLETRENQTGRPQAHRVYSVMRNLGIAFGVTVVAIIACAAAPRVKCGAKGHEWSSRTDWGEK